jgi:sensor c-di-GMP phosphodiesterase-like protein
VKVSASSPSLLAELQAIIAERRVQALYQPVVDIDTGAVVAYEALARGAQGSPTPCLPP